MERHPESEAETVEFDPLESFSQDKRRMADTTTNDEHDGIDELVQEVSSLRFVLSDDDSFFSAVSDISEKRVEDASLKTVTEDSTQSPTGATSPLSTPRASFPTSMMDSLWQLVGVKSSKTMELEETVTFEGGENDLQSHTEEGGFSSSSSTSVRPLRQKDSTLAEFLDDEPCDMTYGRRIALYLMKRKKWYNPRLGDDTEGLEDDAEEQAHLLNVTPIHKPSLAKAWAYFEHVSLSRYVVRPKQNPQRKFLLVRIIRKFLKRNKQLQRAEPGEKRLPTRLYSPIFTPHKQLGDWGLGVGLYFATLRAMAVITLLCGLLSFKNILYFSSDEYSAGQEGIPSLLQGSAICTQTRWVPCPGCNASLLPNDRLAYASIESGMSYTFALQNECDGATIEQGMVNLATLFLFCLGILGLNKYLDWIEVEFDEDEQTAQDYSLFIKNPPGDATDPEEWRTFFAENFGAALSTCTIGVDNDLLVRTLVERREVLRKLELNLEPGSSLDMLDLAKVSARIERARSNLAKIMSIFAPGVPEFFAKLVALTARVQGLAQQEYPASHIFVTFEREEDQRRVLTAISVGTRAESHNDVAAIANPKHLFRGKHVLSVREASEPNTIRWQDLNMTFKDRLKQQASSTVSTIVCIFVIALAIKQMDQVSPVFSAYAIALFNAAFPQFAKLLTSLESHPTEGRKQTSLYFKIAVFRWVNTAIVLAIIKPFTATVSDANGLVSHVYALFFAEITTTNAIQLADPWGHIQRHFLAPRAATQDAMNLKFAGQEFELAERYTNMTKIVFLAVWYSSIYPSAFFMCAFALFINYFVDRFSLMRTWKRPPQLGNSISKFNRRYFFGLAVVTMAVISSFYWSGFPFDNICQDEAFVDEGILGSHTLVRYDGQSVEQPVWVESSDKVFRYCNQDLFRAKGNSFPFISKQQPEGDEWMNSQQELLTDIYGWSSVVFSGTVLMLFLIRFAKSLQGRYKSTYKPCGDVQGINFSDAPSMSAYVPQVTSRVFSYPLLACSISGIDPELLDWTDPDRSHSYYDLTKDAEKVLRGMNVSDTAVFSQIAHWPAQHSTTSLQEANGGMDAPAASEGEEE